MNRISRRRNDWLGGFARAAATHAQVRYTDNPHRQMGDVKRG